MPRGNEAKAARSHNRACMRGRSTANSSASAYNQIKGKKYKKGETSSIFDWPLSNNSIHPIKDEIGVPN